MNLILVFVLTVLGVFSNIVLGKLQNFKGASTYNAELDVNKLSPLEFLIKKVLKIRKHEPRMVIPDSRLSSSDVEEPSSHGSKENLEEFNNNPTKPKRKVKVYIIKIKNKNNHGAILRSPVDTMKKILRSLNDYEDLRITRLSLRSTYPPKSYQKVIFSDEIIPSKKVKKATKKVRFNLETTPEEEFVKHTPPEYDVFGKHKPPEADDFETHTTPEEEAFEKQTTPIDDDFIKHTTTENDDFEKQTTPEDENFEKTLTTSTEDDFEKHTTPKDDDVVKHTTPEDNEEHTTHLDKESEMSDIEIVTEDINKSKVSTANEIENESDSNVESIVPSSKEEQKDISEPPKEEEIVQTAIPEVYLDTPTEVLEVVTPEANLKEDILQDELGGPSDNDLRGRTDSDGTESDSEKSKHAKYSIKNKYFKEKDESSGSDFVMQTEHVDWSDKRTSRNYKGKRKEILNSEKSHYGIKGNKQKIRQKYTNENNEDGNLLRLFNNDATTNGIRQTAMIFEVDKKYIERSRAGSDELDTFLGNKNKQGIVTLSKILRSNPKLASHIFGFRENPNQDYFNDYP